VHTLGLRHTLGHRHTLTKTHTQTHRTHIHASMSFLKLHIGAMHAHHPGILQLQPFAMHERSKAEEGLMLRQVGVFLLLIIGTRSTDSGKGLFSSHCPGGWGCRRMVNPDRAQM
jgi:hypothetical protein